jgi:hypothetical protein
VNDGELVGRHAAGDGGLAAHDEHVTAGTGVYRSDVESDSLTEYRHVHIGQSAPTAGPKLALPEIVTLAVGAVVVLLVVDRPYGYHRDELYFRMIARRPAWGYFDQPPLTPMLARASTLFGDSLWALRMPAALCVGLFMVLAALVAHELGGRRGAQLLAGAGAGLAPYTLAAGTALITNVVDLPLWTSAVLFIVRALRREDGRWWLAAGAMVGLATYNKYLIVLLVIGLLVGLLAVGPRAVLADRRLWLAIVVVLVLATPNLLYQATHGWPQLTMARVLSVDHGRSARIMFVPLQFLLIGPPLAPVWITGWVSLARQSRLRALAVAYPVAVLLAIFAGGRGDYVFSLLVLLYIAGCVAITTWLSQARWRRVLMVVVLSLNVAVAVVEALSVVPVTVVGRTSIPSLNAVARDSIGWPRFVDQVSAVYHGLARADQAKAVLVMSNYGEAGALDLYGPRLGLPSVYSGHNELYKWGPPPNWATVAVVVGLSPDLERAAFTSCETAGRVDNGVGVNNAEQGRPIQVCRQPRAPWPELWPRFAHSRPYG